jgi:SAM-dependent methyltransferase
MIAELRARRRQIDQDVRAASARRYLSPAFYGQYLAVAAAFRSLRGRVIDLGCGIMPYAELLPPAVTLYHGLDITVRDSRPTLIGDVQSLGMLRDAAYDSVVCLEVLEHVPDPAHALEEIARILTDDGVLVLSVPHLSRLHEVPHDYYRYTEYGLDYLLRRSGLEIEMLQTRGGLFSFLGHQAATVLLGLAWGSSGIGAAVRWLNRWLLTYPCYGLDKIGAQQKLFPLGYVLVARRARRARARPAGIVGPREDRL